MAFEYRYTNVTPATWAGMTQTGFLNDGTVGDTATGVPANKTVSGTSSPWCSIVVSEAILTVIVYLGTSHTLTAYSAVGGLTATENVGSTCLESPDTAGQVQTPGAATSGLYTSPDGSTWTLRHNASLTAPDLTGDPPYSTSFSLSQALTPVSACWVKFVVTNSQNIIASDGSVVSQITLTDLRLTGTDTGVSCSDAGGGGGGGEEGGGGGGGEPPVDGDCPCEWAQTETTCGTWEASADASCDWTKTPCRE